MESVWLVVPDSFFLCCFSTSFLMSTEISVPLIYHSPVTIAEKGIIFIE